MYTDVFDPYLYYSEKQQISDMLKEESLRMVNEKLKEYIRSCESFRLAPKELEKILSLYLKKYVGRGLNHLIINFSKANPQLFLLVSDFKEEIVKPLNPRLIFKFVEIKNPDHYRLLDDLFKAFSRNLLFTDKDPLVRINLVKMFKTLSIINYDLSQLTYISPFHDDLCHIHTPMLADTSVDDGDDEEGDDEDDYEEVVQEDEQLTEKEKREKRKRDRKKTEYDFATSSVIKDFYINTIITTARSLYERDLTSRSQIKSVDIELTNELYDVTDKGELHFTAPVINESLLKMFPDIDFKKRDKMNRVTINVVKELYSKKFVEERIKKSNSPVVNIIRILARRKELEDSTPSVIWRYFHIFEDDNVSIITIRPFVKMLY